MWCCMIGTRVRRCARYMEIMNNQ
uniref:Uncharacterized protein n=1 Tax=Zea mays TaxID=4577 RepID=C4J7Z2_MAIZE|nr:unknown [Zea mays]